MKLDEKTYGATPAAMYLARTLNELNEPGFARGIGKRISTTCKMVEELTNAFYVGNLPAKTFANILRLMRLEITTEKAEFPDRSKYRLVEMLRKNVQIGHIKKAIRLASINRKAQRVMDNPTKKGRVVDTCTSQTGFETLRYTMTDHETGSSVHVGSAVFDSDGKITKTYMFPIVEGQYKETTPDLLMERSNRRCARQGKSHMKANHAQL